MKRIRKSLTLFATVLAGAAGFLASGQSVIAQSGAVLPGGNSKQPVNIQAGKLDYFDKEQKLVYTGNVVAIQGTSKLKCTVLVIFLPPKTEGQNATPSSSSQVQHMDATGPVTMVSKDQVGTGDNGTYDKGRDKVVLTGHVTLTQGPNVTLGDHLEYDLKSGEAHVTVAPGGTVRSMFVPDSNSSEPTSKKTGSGRGSRS